MLAKSRRDRMKRIGRVLIKIIDIIILWCFGWKAKRFKYHFADFPDQYYWLWRDPKEHNRWLPRDFAIKACESRIRGGIG